MGAAISAIFFAGVMWAQGKQGRRDLNGLGRKMNKVQMEMLVSESDETRRRELARRWLEP